MPTQHPYWNPEHLTDDLERCLRGQERDVATVLFRITGLPSHEINRIWSRAIQRMAWPPRTKPSLWERICSIFSAPTDHKPGSQWQ
jgi:hypothetical protein